MSKVHERKEEPYHRIAKKMEHASPESGHDFLISMDPKDV
jgi:hypothetical protein